MKLIEFIDSNNIDMQLVAVDKFSAIDALAALLDQNGYLNDKQAYLEAVAERESHCTTGIGNAVAIPHGKTAAVKRSSIAVGKLAKAVDWQAMDDQPVEVVFLLAIGENDAGDLHLKLLQQIAVKLMDDAIVAALRSACDKASLLAALEMEPEEL